MPSSHNGLSAAMATGLYDAFNRNRHACVVQKAANYACGVDLDALSSREYQRDLVRVGDAAASKMNLPDRSIQRAKDRRENGCDTCAVGVHSANTLMRS
jgi:hypothetical protein